MTINATKSEPTSFTPFEIIYGHTMSLPESVITNLPQLPFIEPT